MRLIIYMEDFDICRRPIRTPRAALATACYQARLGIFVPAPQESDYSAKRRVSVTSEARLATERMTLLRQGVRTSRLRVEHKPRQYSLKMHGTFEGDKLV